MPETLDFFYGYLEGKYRNSKRTQLYKWKEKATVIHEKAAVAKTATKLYDRGTGHGLALTLAIEEHIATWVREMRGDGIPVTRLMLQLKARAVAKDCGINVDGFRASRSWIQRFMKRTGLSDRARTRVGQSKRADGQKVMEAFASEIRELMTKKGIDVVYNADQTGTCMPELYHPSDENGYRRH